MHADGHADGYAVSLLQPALCMCNLHSHLHCQTHGSTSLIYYVAIQELLVSHQTPHLIYLFH